MRSSLKPKVKLPCSQNYGRINSILKKHNLHTVCEEASCPNLGECWDSGTATFMILGDICTRNCLYCNVKSGKPMRPDKKEPKRIAEVVSKLGLNYVVITSVTRDDLEDGGASAFAACIKEIRKLNRNIKVELLIPDYSGDSLKKLVDANPDVLNHNIEVVEPLFKRLRPQGDYRKSLQTLKDIKKINKNQVTKSGFIIGFGEIEKDIKSTIENLRKADVDILTIGQYLRPSLKNVPVEKYYLPEDFNKLREYAVSIGIQEIKCGPLVRSSYKASHMYKKVYEHQKD
ncbi:lipoyl synthase [Candidatus Woesearchaeota archaeon]|nr:lipoyl synthase [Candidatus Woesearchaeota archaeon]